MNMLHVAAELFHSKKTRTPKFCRQPGPVKLFQFGVVDLFVHYDFPKFCKIHGFQHFNFNFKKLTSIN